MFTGLIESLGTVIRVQDTGAGRMLTVRDSMGPQLAIGESVAINGACLTVVEVRSNDFAFEVGPETLLKTNLGALCTGDRVNLERSLRVGDRLGGHFVQGHGDARGTIDARVRKGDREGVSFRPPADVARPVGPEGG